MTVGSMRREKHTALITKGAYCSPPPPALEGISVPKAIIYLHVASTCSMNLAEQQCRLNLDVTQ